MSSNISTASDDSDVFYVEQSPSEPSPRKHNTPNILNSTEISEQHTTQMPSISSIASTEPHIFTIDDDSNEPTIPYGFGHQVPIIPPSLNDLNLPLTLSTSWRQWLWYIRHRAPMMTTIARSHRSPRNCHPYQRPQ